MQVLIMRCVEGMAGRGVDCTREMQLSADMQRCHLLLQGAGRKSGGGAGSPAGGAYRTGKKAEGGSKSEQAKQDKPQVSH